MSHFLLLTCEHAGNFIPEEYAHLFSGHEEVLYSDKAIDLGALRLAKYVSSSMGVPLHYTIISRLLVEANRAPENPDLFSEFVKDQSEEIKHKIMENHYWPHRNEVEDKVRRALDDKSKVIHVALHTFAPVKEGKVRDTDMGILCDPERSQELIFAERLKKEILKTNSRLHVGINKPYDGTDDCLPRYLRERFSAQYYLGLEIEVNQKFFLNGEPEVWESIVKEVTTALSSSLD